MFENLDFVDRRRLLILYRACQIYRDYGPVGPAAGISKNLASLVLKHLDDCKDCRTFMVEELMRQSAAEQANEPIDPQAHTEADDAVKEWQRETAVSALMGPDHILNQIQTAEQELALAQGIARKIELFLAHLNNQLPKDN